ncbi:hypothetical protein ACQPZX_14410 [Actinoplanes sp. CA-142083]|uniref:hypothetical protein n=1 Tax=Actinoplanes sp. CA-142083 TaxID=3239903 RepID=UPI003D8F3D90
MRTHSMLRAFVAFIGLVLAVPTVIATSPTSARAAPDVVAAAAWNPRVVPLYSNETKVALDSAEARKRFLDLCQTEDLNGYACITVGDGDGTHSGFAMFKCGWRKVYDFINAGALVNNQYGGARVRLYNAAEAEIASYGNGRFGIPNEILYATEWISIC